MNYLGLIPNLLISLRPNYLMPHWLEPLTPGRTTIECSWSSLPEVEDPADALEAWDLTNRETWATCESAHARPTRPWRRPHDLPRRRKTVRRPTPHRFPHPSLGGPWVGRGFP